MLRFLVSSLVRKRASYKQRCCERASNKLSFAPSPPSTEIQAVHPEPNARTHERLTSSSMRWHLRLATYTDGGRNVAQLPIRPTRAPSQPYLYPSRTFSYIREPSMKRQVQHSRNSSRSAHFRPSSATLEPPRAKGKAKAASRSITTTSGPTPSVLGLINGHAWTELQRSQEGRSQWIMYLQPGVETQSFSRPG